MRTYSRELYRTYESIFDDFRMFDVRSCYGICENQIGCSQAFRIIGRKKKIPHYMMTPNRRGQEASCGMQKRSTYRNDGNNRRAIESAQEIQVFIGRAECQGDGGNRFGH